MSTAGMKEKKYLKVLREMYHAQMESFFPHEAMPKVMERLGLSDEEAIAYVKYFLENGLVKKPAHRPSFFLRAGYIQSFPVTLTSSGISLLKKGE